MKKQTEVNEKVAVSRKMQFDKAYDKAGKAQLRKPMPNDHVLKPVSDMEIVISAMIGDADSVVQGILMIARDETIDSDKVIALVKTMIKVYEKCYC